MKREDWERVRVGSVLRDRRCIGAPLRLVLEVSRVSGKPAQCGNVRVCIRVPNLRAPEKTTVIFSTEDSPGYERFELVSE